MIDKICKFLKRWSYFPLILLPLITILLRAPLSGSLWVDETISAWVISGDPFIRAIETQGQSPLYFVLLKATTLVFGTTEIALRFISVLSYLVSAFLFWWISVRLIGVLGGGVATTALVASDPVIVAAISARPYGLALVLSLATIAPFLKWIESGKWRWCFLYQIFWSLTFYAHYLFVGIGLILPFFAIAGVRVVSWRKIIFSSVFPFILFSFGIPHLAILYDKKDLLSFVTRPSLQEVLFGICEPVLFVAAVISLIFALIIEPKPKISWPNPKIIFLCIIWGVLPVLGFYFINEGSLFIPRYFLWHTGGTALFIGALISAFKSERTSSLAALIFTTLLLSREIQRTYVIEDWKQSSSKVLEIINLEQSKAPVFLYSGLVEANDISSSYTKENFDYLTSPFHYYSVGSNTQVFPLPLSLGEGGYFNSSVLTAIEKFGSVICVVSYKELPGIDHKDSFKHFESEFQSRGVKTKVEKDYSLVRVLRLTK